MILGTLLKAGLAVAAVGLGLDLLKKREDAAKEKNPRLPLLKDRDLPNGEVDLPQVINLATKEKEPEKKEQEEQETKDTENAEKE